MSSSAALKSKITQSATLATLKIKSCYKDLMRASRQAFPGDLHAQQLCRQRVRQEFSKPLTCIGEINEETLLEKRLETGRQAAYILRHHTIQLELKKDSAESNTGSDKNKDPLIYKVKIDRERHELGDNESRFGKRSLTKDPCGCHTCYD